MVGQRTVSIVRVFAHCLENKKLQYIWIAEFRGTTKAFIAKVSFIYILKGKTNMVCLFFSITRVILCCQ